MLQIFHFTRSQAKNVWKPLDWITVDEQTKLFQQLVCLISQQNLRGAFGGDATPWEFRLEGGLENEKNTDSHRGPPCPSRSPHQTHGERLFSASASRVQDDGGGASTVKYNYTPYVSHASHMLEYFYGYNNLTNRQLSWVGVEWNSHLN